MRLLPCLLLALALLVTAAAPAGATGASKHARFAKSKLTYRDASDYGPAVAQAVALWNQAGTKVRLRPARKRKKPHIRITSHARVLHRGVEVAGTGGGTDKRGKRRRGRVKLSVAALGDGATATPEQVNVAAHEIGHALGLPHTMGACDLMNETATAEARGCASPAGFYRCGPQREDAQALAQRYGGRADYPADGGLCARPAPAAEILGPPAEITLPPGGIAQLQVRNTGTAAWEQYDLFATYVDPNGDAADSPCIPDTNMRFSMNEAQTAPGAVATFDIATCGEPGSRTTYSVRLFDDREAGQPFGFGPVHTFTVTS